jgi:hypothetical protein
MTAEKLFGILQFLDTTDNTLGIQRNLEAIRDALKQLTSSPAETSYQNALASALGAFGGAEPKLRDRLTQSQLAAIKGMGGAEFFEPSMFDKVKNVVQTNAMTPAVARDFVHDLASRRSQFLTNVRTARQGLQSLNVREDLLEPNSADIAFLIPRNIFDNELGPFAKELKFITRLVEHYSEAITGQVEPPKLERLSSSEPTVALLLSLPVLLGIGKVVNSFLDAWEKIEKIRKLRAELSEIGLKGVALEQLDEQITTTIHEVVEESVEFVIADYPGDGNRKAELRNALSSDTLRLFGQIERGLSIEIRVNRTDGDTPEGEEQKALKDAEDLGKVLRFPEAAEKPMLLQGEQVLDDEVLVVSQTKKSRKTTVSKKESKEGKGDPGGKS